MRNSGGARIEYHDKEEEYTGCIKALHDASYLNKPKNAQSFTVTHQMEKLEEPLFSKELSDLMFVLFSPLLKFSNFGVVSITFQVKFETIVDV